VHFHFKLHKPYGYLSQFVGEKASQKKLGELFAFPEGTMAIGRLDKQSEGLLLLTTDGKISEWIRSSAIEKEYWVQLDGDISEIAVESLRNGVDIDIEDKKFTTSSCRVEKLLASPPVLPRSKHIRSDHHGPTSWISIILKEGKFRQIRKMTAKVGYPTLRLIRFRIGTIFLGDMKSGEVEPLNNLTEFGNSVVNQSGF